MPPADPSTKILIIEDNPDVLGVLDSMLTREGYATIRSTDGEAALAAARAEDPDLVLLDLNLAGQAGLEVCRRIKSEPSIQDSVVIVLGSVSDTLVKEQSLNTGAVDYIQKPFRQAELLARIKAQLRQKRDLDALRLQYHQLAERLSRNLENLREDVDQECVVGETKQLSIPSDVSRVQPVVHQLLLGLGPSHGSKLRSDLALGLHETLVNAIEHGNLEVSTEEKREALEVNGLDQLLEERRADPRLGERRVTVQYELRDGEVVYRIADEGPGFDWRPFLEKEEPDDLLSISGRGIMIARYLFDGMEYNEAGNEVTLRKSLDDDSCAPCGAEAGSES